jgi:hypothetical protein
VTSNLRIIENTMRGLLDQMEFLVKRDDYGKQSIRKPQIKPTYLSQRLEAA